MDEAGREARRKALAEEVARLKRAADGEVVTAPVIAPKASESSDELDWDVDDEDDARDSSLNPSSLGPSSLSASDPSLDSLDSSWDDEEEPEIPEPELPDENENPEAYAAAKAAYAEAKAARAERAEARRERRRAKDAAKKALRKQRADDLKRKQKGKKVRVSAPPKPPSAKAERKRARASEPAIERPSLAGADATKNVTPKKTSSKAIAKKQPTSSTNPLIFGAVLALFIGAVIYAIMRAR